jgi:hypothetical protein
MKLSGVAVVGVHRQAFSIMSPAKSAQPQKDYGITNLAILMVTAAIVVTVIIVATADVVADVVIITTM